MKYAYQELPQPEKTASPRSQKVERKREHEFIREPLGLPPWNGQWQNNLPLGD
jgi:hypothetical protein